MSTAVAQQQEHEGSGDGCISRRATTATTTSSSSTAQNPAPVVVSEDQRRLVVRNSLLAGSAAGIVSTVACHPFDVIRTKMQSAAMIESTSVGSTSSRAAATTNTTTSGVISQTFKNGGIRALYTGLALPLAAQAVYKGTVFTVNNVTQQAIVDWHSKNGANEYKLTMMDRFFCGFAGGGVNAALFVTPVEFVRNQLIAQHTRQVASGKTLKQTSWNVIQSTLKKTGPSGLWRGVGVTMARDSIGCGCFFYGMEASQQYFAGDEKPTLATTILSGAVAGIAFWLAALPLDTTKTWVQSGNAESAFGAVQTSFRKYGFLPTVRRLCSGYQMAYARGIPSAAITVTTYSLCYKALQQQPTIQ